MNINEQDTEIYCNTCKEFNKLKLSCGYLLCGRCKTVIASVRDRQTAIGTGGDTFREKYTNEVSEDLKGDCYKSSKGIQIDGSIIKDKHNEIKV